MKDTAKYLCPKCRQRVRVFVRGADWYWENHKKADGSWCENAGQKLGSGPFKV